MRLKNRFGHSLMAASFTFAALAGPAQTQDINEQNPTDFVKPRFSVAQFSALSEIEVFDVVLAVKRGRGILIDGCTRSESRVIIRQAGKDQAAAIKAAQQTCG